MLVTSSYEERREEERVGSGEEGEEGREGRRETMFELNQTGRGFDLSRGHQSVTAILENESWCEKSGYLIFWGGYVFPFMVL